MADLHKLCVEHFKYPPDADDLASLERLAKKAYRAGAEEALAPIRAIVEDVKNYEWGHADHCQHKGAPYSECPTPECDPVNAIIALAQKGQGEG